MPSLKGLSCSIELSPEQKLHEYGTTYGDGFVETFVAIPSEPTQFSIRLFSRAYIAEGLAMFVYIDGEYQCNRNRRGLEEPKDLSKPLGSRNLINFLVRQKEELRAHQEMIAREWRFEKLNIVSADQAPKECSPNTLENIGCIEVVVVRCKGKIQSLNLDGSGDMRVPPFGLDGHPKEWGYDDRDAPFQGSGHSGGHRITPAQYEYVRPDELHRPTPYSTRASSYGGPPEYSSQQSTTSYRVKNSKGHMASAAASTPSRSHRSHSVHTLPSNVDEPNIPPSAYQYGTGPVPHGNPGESTHDLFAHRTARSIPAESLIDPTWLKTITEDAYRRGLEEAQRKKERADIGHHRETTQHGHSTILTPQPPGAWNPTYDHPRAPSAVTNKSVAWGDQRTGDGRHMSHPQQKEASSSSDWSSYWSAIKPPVPSPPSDPLQPGQTESQRHRRSGRSRKEVSEWTTHVESDNLAGWGDNRGNSGSDYPSSTSTILSPRAAIARRRHRSEHSSTKAPEDPGAAWDTPEDSGWGSPPTQGIESITSDSWPPSASQVGSHPPPAAPVSGKSRHRHEKKEPKTKLPPVPTPPIPESLRKGRLPNPPPPYSLPMPFFELTSQTSTGDSSATLSWPSSRLDDSSWIRKTGDAASRASRGSKKSHKSAEPAKSSSSGRKSGSKKDSKSSSGAAKEASTGGNADQNGWGDNTGWGDNNDTANKDTSGDKAKEDTWGDNTGWGDNNDTANKDTSNDKDKQDGWGDNNDTPNMPGSWNDNDDAKAKETNSSKPEETGAGWNTGDAKDADQKDSSNDKKNENEWTGGDNSGWGDNSGNDWFKDADKKYSSADKDQGNNEWSGGDNSGWGNDTKDSKDEKAKSDKADDDNGWGNNDTNAWNNDTNKDNEEKKEDDTWGAGGGWGSGDADNKPTDNSGDAWNTTTSNKQKSSSDTRSKNPSTSKTSPNYRPPTPFRLPPTPPIPNPAWKFPPKNHLGPSPLEPPTANTFKPRQSQTPTTLPAEPLHTLSEPAAKAKGLTHQVRPGVGTRYTHAIDRPVYIDDFEAPYAVFRFKYRSRGYLQALLGKEEVPDVEESGPGKTNSGDETASVALMREKVKGLSEEQKVEEIVRLARLAKSAGAGEMKDEEAKVPSLVKSWVNDQRERSRRNSLKSAGKGSGKGSVKSLTKESVKSAGKDNDSASKKAAEDTWAGFGGDWGLGDGNEKAGSEKGEKKDDEWGGDNSWGNNDTGGGGWGDGNEKVDEKKDDSGGGGWGDAGGDKTGNW